MNSPGMQDQYHFEKFTDDMRWPVGCISNYHSHYLCRVMLILPFTLVSFNISGILNCHFYADPNMILVLLLIVHQCHNCPHPRGISKMPLNVSFHFGYCQVWPSNWHCDSMIKCTRFKHLLYKVGVCVSLLLLCACVVSKRSPLSLSTLCMIYTVHNSLNMASELESRRSLVNLRRIIFRLSSSAHFDSGTRCPRIYISSPPALSINPRAVVVTLRRTFSRNVSLHKVMRWTFGFQVRLLRLPNSETVSPKRICSPANNPLWARLNVSDNIKVGRISVK